MTENAPTEVLRLCKDFEEFLEVYSIEGSSKKFLLEGSYYTVRSLKKLVDLESYLEERLLRPECSNPECSSKASFSSLSRRGWSKCCSSECGFHTEKFQNSCKSKLDYALTLGRSDSQESACRRNLEIANEKFRVEGMTKLQLESRKASGILAAARNNKLNGAKAMSHPNTRFYRNLKAFSKYSEVKLYLVSGIENCKFGLTVHESRISKMEGLVDAKETLVWLLESETASRVEADLILIGQNKSELFGGCTEFRSSIYYEEIKNYIISKVGERCLERRA